MNREYYYIDPFHLLILREKAISERRLEHVAYTVNTMITKRLFSGLLITRTLPKKEEIGVLAMTGIRDVLIIGRDRNRISSFGQ